METIFSSYRRGGTEGEVNRLYTDQVGEFGKTIIAHGPGRPDSSSAGAENKKESVSGLIAATAGGRRSVSTIVCSSAAVLLVILVTASMLMSKENPAPAGEQESSQSAPTSPASPQSVPEAGGLAPKPVVPNIDGSWHQVQNICLKWDISQHGDAFTLAYNCVGVRFKGSGTIRGLIMEYAYNAVNLLGIRSKGTCTGVISSDGASFHINSCMDNLAGYMGPSDFVRPGADQ